MEKEITVQELINQLNQIENKNIPVDIVLLDDGIGPLKKGEHTRFEKLVFNTSKPSGKVVSVSQGVDGMEKYVREEFDDFVSVADKPECQEEIEEWTQLFRGDRQFAILSCSKKIFQKNAVIFLFCDKNSDLLRMIG